MPDVHDIVTRSRNMAAIKAINTKPELTIRKLLHKNGFRYKVHGKLLPGKPDLVFPKYNAVIFINGCFWHHHDCHLFKWPQTRQEFWTKKITGNVANDKKKMGLLHEDGWRIGVVWECAMKGRNKLDTDTIISRIADWLHENNPVLEIAGII